MTRITFFLFLISLTLPAKLHSQVSFSASPRNGCDSLTVTFTYTGATIPGTIIWRFGNGDTSHRVNPLPVLYSQPGMYEVSVTVNGSTILTEPQFIKVRAMPAADFTYHDTLDPTSLNFVFQPLNQPVDTAVYAYKWYFPDDSSTFYTWDAVHQFPAEGLFPVQLFITDDFGCSDSISRLVNASPKIIIPNVFTPNGDGINEVVTVPVSGISIYSFKIFSRYGILIYKNESKFPFWDGTNTAGVMMEKGVYYYTLESLDPDHPLNQAGFIHLFK